MRRAGIREARQNLSELIDQVKKGQEVLITDRGKPVARLVPAKPMASKPFPDLSAFRKRMPVLDPPLSEILIEEREDRI